MSYRNTPLSRKQYLQVEDLLLDYNTHYEVVRQQIWAFQPELAVSAVDEVIETIFKNIEADETQAEIEAEARYNQ